MSCQLIPIAVMYESWIGSIQTIKYAKPAIDYQYLSRFPPLSVISVFSTAFIQGHCLIPFFWSFYLFSYSA